MILVTGGTGFIGSNIVVELVRRGADVVVCDRHLNDHQARNIAGITVVGMVEAEQLAAWLNGRRGLEAVVHMGAISATTHMDVDLVMRTNVLLSLELWDWCTSNRVPFLYASSAQVYGDGSSGFDDDQATTAMAGLKAVTPYGVSKLLFDRLVVRERDGGRNAPPQWAGMRFFNVYGPREGHKGAMRSVIARTLPDLLAGQPLKLFRSTRPDYDDGGQMRDFIHVKDCVDVVCWMLENPEVSGIFNVGTGTARTWLDLGHAMFAALGRLANIAFIDMPDELQGRYQYFTEARMERLRDAGYLQPFTRLEEGVADYVNNHLVPATRRVQGGQQ